MRKHKDTAMKELVEGGRLQRADIMLAHYKRSFYGWLIRLTTRCYWNHAFIIYMVADLEGGFDKVLIIDPKMGSIHMDDIAYYLANPKKYDVAVKRLDKDWFQKDIEAGGLPFCRTVCDVALRETAEKYDTRVIKYCRKSIRLLRLGYRYARRRIRYPGKRQKRLIPFTRRLKMNTYSCSGFVQWVYYLGVSRILKDSADKTLLQDVIFSPRLARDYSDFDLLSTTPADLAKSDKISWKYVVKDGVVWEIDGGEGEVEAILKPKKEASST